MILPRRRGTMPRATALADEEHPGEVRPDHLVPGRRIHLEERAAALDPGIVDEDVDRADLRLDASDFGANLRFLRDIEPGALDPQSLAAQGGYRCGELLLVAAVDDHCRAGLGEAARQRKPDAGGGAGDERDPSGQVEKTGSTWNTLRLGRLAS